MKFFKIKYGVFAFAMSIGLASCVQFKKASLYDGVEEVPVAVKPTDLNVIVEPIIYDEDATDVWGLQKDGCQEAMITEEAAYSGKESIKINWNRNAAGCDFAGIGIGWDSYAGKDLTPIMDFAAIQFYVRTQKGKSYGLPFVLTLIDYSKGMGFSYTSNKYFERTAIDEEWQKVIVPLNTFDLATENLDPSNIAQLQIELQQSGSIYLDDISLVFFEAQPQEMWMTEEVLPDPTKTPIQIFDDKFINDNGWGLMTNACQAIKLTEVERTEGKSSLHVKWNTRVEDCRLTAFGVSWNKWKPVDLNPILKTAALQFDIKVASGELDKLPINFGFEDYDRAKTFVKWNTTFIQDSQYSAQWKRVTIPISAIPKGGVDFKRIKQLYVSLEGNGEVFIDDLKLVDLE